MSMSPLDFVRHLGSSTARFEVRRHEALERIGEHVEQRARGYIGHEQDGWPALAESTIADKARHGYEAPAPLLRDGTMRDSIGHEVRGDHVVVGASDKTAVWQELGTERIPPRPFLAKAALESEPELREIAEELALKLIIGRK